MTETENKYQRGKIYRIICNITNLCYVGSTTYHTLAQRLSVHKTDFKRWKENKLKHKCSSVNVLESNNYNIILIENFPCNCRDELECVNLVLPSRTRQEYLIDNKDKILSSRKEHYYSNHERKLEIARTYREKNPDKVIECNKKQAEMPPILCECGMYYTYKHKARHLSSKRHINSTR